MKPTDEQKTNIERLAAKTLAAVKEYNAYTEHLAKEECLRYGLEVGTKLVAVRERGANRNTFVIRSITGALMDDGEFVIDIHCSGVKNTWERTIMTVEEAKKAKEIAGRKGNR